MQLPYHHATVANAIGIRVPSLDFFMPRFVDMDRVDDVCLSWSWSSDLHLLFLALGELVHWCFDGMGRVDVMSINVDHGAT